MDSQAPLWYDERMLRDGASSPPGAEAKQRLDEAWSFIRRAYEFQTAAKLDEAIICYKKSIEVCPTAEAHTFLGWTYSAQGRYDRAIEECRRAIRVDPAFGNPYNDIGAYLIEQGRFSGAIPWLQLATVAKRYDARAFPHLNLGRVYERLGQWRDALTAYERALHANPDYLLAVQSLNRLKAMFS